LWLRAHNGQQPPKNPLKQMNKKKSTLDNGQFQVYYHKNLEDLDDSKTIYIASESYQRERVTAGHEKIQTAIGAKLRDRREKVISDQNKRSIIRCIGRIVADYEDKDQFGNSLVSCGTGTVYAYDDSTGYVYVISCAHIITKKKYGVKKKPFSIRFERRHTFRFKKPKVDKTYSCILAAAHPKYQYDNQDPNDLAFLIFKDDGYYQNIFRQHKNIQLFQSDLLNGECEYEIYGYPTNDDPFSRVSLEEDYVGELWGMKAPSLSFQEYNGKALLMYVKQKGDFFVYTAIDTEGGQSGSAIFVEINGDYYIIGIHTGGERGCENYGIALTEDKMRWIKSKETSYRNFFMMFGSIFS